MPWPLTVLFVAGAVLLTAISATLSFLFCRSLGGTAIEGLAYGTAAATLDVLKALAPFALVQCWRKRQLGAAAAASLLWSIAVIVSLSSAMGLAAQNRLGKSGAHESRQAQFHDAQRQIDEHRQRLGGLEAARPSSEIEAILQAQLSRPITTAKRVRTLVVASDNCSRPDRLTADACLDVGRIRSELARAQERERLERRIAALWLRIDELRREGAGEGSEADRQASVIMRAWHVVTGASTTLTLVQTALIALMAIALEVGSSCGLYAALGSHIVPRAAADVSATEVWERRPAVSETGDVAAYCKKRVIARAGARVAMGQVMEDYGRWCTGLGLQPAPRQRFMRELRAEGQACGWSMAGGVIHHVGLRTDNGRGH